MANKFKIHKAHSDDDIVRIRRKFLESVNKVLDLLVARTKEIQQPINEWQAQPVLAQGKQRDAVEQIYLTNIKDLAAIKDKCLAESWRIGDSRTTEEKEVALVDDISRFNSITKTKLIMPLSSHKSENQIVNAISGVLRSLTFACSKLMGSRKNSFFATYRASVSHEFKGAAKGMDEVAKELDNYSAFEV